MNSFFTLFSFIKSLCKSTLCAAVFLFTIYNISHAQVNSKEGFSFVAFGDMPYTLPDDYVRFETLIKTVNADTHAFVINVGDIKSSSTPCSEASYTKMYEYYAQFAKPLIYVPGDNEWTDCNKKAAGSYDPEERLGVIRKMFFKDHKTLGKEKFTLTSQSERTAYAKFVENNRWEFGGISFATVHVVGTNNNFVSSSTNGNREFFERDEANIAWLQEIFKASKDKNSAALVIAIHADMYNPKKESKEASGFNRFKAKLKELIIDFQKPVLLINGDSHVFLVDKPIYENEELEKSLNNFTRLQVPGESNIHAVKVTINPRALSMFQIEELRVPGN